MLSWLIASLLSLYPFAEKLQDYPYHCYPYHDLKEQLAEQNQDSLLLFSYGSLMDKQSASRTLSPQTLQSYRYALAFGVQRYFDRDVPIYPNSKWGIPDDPRARGMLNVRKTDYLEQFVNGVLIEVPLNDIQDLLKREEEYHLMPVVVVDWEAFLRGEEAWQIAYTLYASQSAPSTSLDILPRPHYYELVRDAAKGGGPLFELLWYQTTFYANGRPIYESSIR